MPWLPMDQLEDWEYDAGLDMWHRQVGSLRLLTMRDRPRAPHHPGEWSYKAEVRHNGTVTWQGAAYDSHASAKMMATRKGVFTIGTPGFASHRFWVED